MSTNAPLLDPLVDSSTSPAQLVGRGILLRREFEEGGRREDLDQAISQQTQAVLLTPIQDQEYPTWLDELGVSLQLRFRHFENLSDINSAVEYHEQAVGLTPETHNDRPKRIKNLGNCLQSRFERLGDVADLQRGIAYLDQAITLAHDNELESASHPSIAIVPVKINNSMPATEILAHLVDHGCPDVTLDLGPLSEHPVANGGLGLVYCDTLRNGSKVAVKIVACLKGLAKEEKGLLKQAAHELHVWSKCTHPCVQELVGVAYVRNQIAMVSQWLEYGTLPEYLKNDRTADRCKMCIQITEGLKYLHGRGIVHGDIKGENILVADDYTPKLTDFGNATLQEYSLRFATTSSKNDMSYRWAAPELFEGGKNSQAADVYALGMTILEVITGQVPFAGMKQAHIMRFVTSGKICERPEEFIPSQSPQGDLLWSILLKCWEFEPSERPSAEVVLNELSPINREGLRRINST